VTELRLGPLAMVWWTTVASVHGLFVIALTWGVPTTSWPLTAMTILAAGLGALALAARRHSAPNLTRLAGFGCLAVVIGVVVGLVRAPRALDPTPWTGFDEGTVTGFVLVAEPDRLVIADPCFTPTDTTQNSPQDCDGPHRLTVARQGWDEQLVAARTMVRVDVSLRERRSAENPTTLPPYPPSAQRFWAKALSEVLAAPDLSVPFLLDVAGAIREALTFHSASGQRASALYQALILGDRSDIASSTRYAYQDTGTAHLLAISGFNLALFGFGFFRIALFFLVRLPWFRTRPAPARIAAALALAVTTFYTALIIPTDATDRALIAIVLSLGLFGLGHETRASRTVALCFTVAMLLDPLALTRAGFQLSFAATVSLILAVPLTARVTGAIKASKHFQNSVIRKLAIALAAVFICDIFSFVATLPIGIVWFGQASFHSLWVNLVAIPWMGLIVFPAGLIQLALGLVLPDLAAVTDPLVAALGVSFEAFIITSGELIGSQQVTPWPWWLGWSIAGLVLLIVGRARAVAWAASAAVMLMLAGWAVFGRGEGLREGLQIDVLDVGHGDAIVIRHPDGGVILVDTGGGFTEAASRSVAERVLIPALGALGVHRIDLLVITHADRDHIGAAPALAERLPIRNLWLPPCAYDTPVARELRLRVERGGGQSHVVTAQEPLRWGEAGDPDSVALHVLWPLDDSRRWDGRCEWDSNDASLVIKLTSAEGSLLLTGDIEAPAEAALVERYGGRLASDILKVPHHGSKTSSTDIFLDAVSPAIALVSGLPGRAPMPPHDLVLQRYADRLIPVAITGRDGALHVGTDEDGTWSLRTRTGRGPNWKTARSAAASPMSFDRLRDEVRAASAQEDWWMLRAP